MDNRQITVIDETLREGMQFRGLMFSREERLRILEFQEGLGVDICQAGYPSAHVSEMETICFLQETVQQKGYRIRPAALGRALTRDIDQITAAGVGDIHLHIALGDMEVQDTAKAREALCNTLRKSVAHARATAPGARIGISLLDIGRTAPEFVMDCAALLIHELGIELLTLPDTSGVLSPGRLSSIVGPIAGLAQGSATHIGVHCHNDLGMATANTVAGVEAGARVVEVTALGIGERNGIGDLFSVGKCLKDQGYHLNLKIGEIDLFRRYYEYVDRLCFEQTGIRLLDERTPFFGKAVRTHVAGTHGRNDYGLHAQADYCLNVLCGKNLVAKFLKAHEIPFDPAALSEITAEIKSRSAAFGRRISAEQAADIVESVGKR